MDRVSPRLDKVRLETDRESMIVQLADNGPGFLPEDLPHIFEKMHRVEKEGPRAVEGSGLGLSIVRRIVELHGGQISVERAMGKGTTFSVRLPLSEANPS